MKEIVITNKNGITLPTKNKLVDDDIKIKVSDSIKSIDGVELISGPISNKDLQIDGSKDFGAIIVDSYNGDLFVTNMLETDQQTNIKVAGYANVKIVDEHPKNLITAENLEPQNIKKDVNILGVTGTFEASSGSGEDLIEALCNDTLTSYSNSNITNLNQYLFYNNTALVNVDLSNVIEIEGNVFYGCTNLKNVNLPNVKKIGIYSFGKCTSLESIDLPNLETTSNYPFIGCTNLKNVNLPKLISVQSGLFENCKTLPSVILPVLISITHNFFFGCTALTDVYLGYEGLVSLVNTSAFSNVTAGVKIHVRSEYADQYATATNWASLIEAGTIVIVGDYSD